MIKLEAGECIGSYRVIEFLARGGFSLVYVAEDTEGERGSGVEQLQLAGVQLAGEE